MGKTAVFGSDKGGVGKTTTVTNTASMLVSKGRTVGILKSDKNNDLFNWNERRKENGLTLSRSTKLTVISVKKSKNWHQGMIICWQTALVTIVRSFVVRLR